MKRFLFVLVAAMIFAGSSRAICVRAAEATTDVYVTIADAEGRLAVTRELISASDYDMDGIISIGDALYAAHESFYAGGAAEGFKTERTEYGLSVVKLWGAENGGSYGYYVNNVSPMSMADAVSTGDSIYAFVYTDLTAWSDTYCFFESCDFYAKPGEKLEVKLLSAGFDASWKPVTLPVTGAELLVNGEPSGIVTDTEGKAVFTPESSGEYIISATSMTQTLVPPVCIITAAEAQDAATAGEVQDTVPEDGAQDTEPAEVLPQTGTESAVLMMAGGLIILAAGCAIVKKNRVRA